jgi:hypothetical protein
VTQFAFLNPTGAEILRCARGDFKQT